MEFSSPELPHTPLERIEHVLEGAIGLCKNPKIAIAADIHRIRESFEHVLSLTPLLSAATEENTAPIEMFEDSLTAALREVEEEEQKEEEKHRKGFAVRLQVVQDYVADLRTLLNDNGNAPIEGDLIASPAVPLERSSLPSS